MKYKKGDRVRIVSKEPEEFYWNKARTAYFGKTMTIKKVYSYYYKMIEDEDKMCWYDNMIIGLASETPFNFTVWKGKNVCMHCKTEEEGEDFCNEMHKAGLKWRSGISYLETSCSNSYRGFLCYFFNEGVYDSVGYAKDSGYRILEWSDYRSTEPPKEEQKKTRADDKLLGYQEALRIYKKICSDTTECIICPLSSDNNDTQISCHNFMINYPEKAEPILKKWLAERPVKTNEQKINEMFLKTFGISYATALAHPDWWQQEYENIDDKIQKRRMNNEEIN